ncbi:enoyl-CoA hydratase/isomerase family protein [Streptomyces hygroscopicus]|uniref:enoyl-CoA hydratase/isomerase family protein n=1 Tax=Streptomyces hygroscopicus TaxID=1912 RepID=UPI003642A6F8
MRDGHGVVTLTMDDRAQRVNTLNERFTSDFACVIDRLEKEVESITGVIIRSAKSSFLAGGDLKRLMAVEPRGRDAFLADLQLRKSRMRRLEWLGRPVVALIEGAALGGGLELALACHRRIAVRSPKTVVGLPEATLGLLPGGGGLVRTTRLLGPGVSRALVLSGIRLGVEDAATLGLLDEVVDTAEAAEAAARAWIEAHPHARQPWDEAVEERRPVANPVAERLQAMPVTRPHRSFAPESATIEGLIRHAAAVPIDEALRLESAGLADLVVGEVAKRTIGVVFVDTVAARGRAREGDAHAVRIDLIPRDEAAAEACAGAGLRPMDPTAPDAPGEAAGVRLEAVADDQGRDVPAGVRVHRDRLDAGGHVLEFWAPDAHAGSVAAWLAKTGGLPVRVSGLGPGFVERVSAAVDTRCAALVATGASAAEVSQARVAAGLAAVPLNKTTPPVTPRVLEYADRLVDAAARAAVGALKAGVPSDPRDLDVASVRIAGLPAWTGGATRWLNRRKPDREPTHP